MIRTLIVTSLLFASACRINHLGAEHGVASRTAWAAQRESDPERKPQFGADDAKAANAARRTDKGKAGGSTEPAPGSILISPPTSSGTSGGWQGAKGNMSLEAK